MEEDMLHGGLIYLTKSIAWNQHLRGWFKKVKIAGLDFIALRMVSYTQDLLAKSGLQMHFV